MTHYSGNDYNHMDSMEKHSVDLNHSFDLNGTENDETLRHYLRKAGCSDKIEYLTPEQRKAFIYDIIKSNKMPGHWVPSTMRINALPTAANVSPTTSILSSSSSSNSLKSLPQNSPHMQRYLAPSHTPPSPSIYNTSFKGSKYEISRPTNFQHVSGDMSRDKTRNAFDLTEDTNDKMLKKYIIENNIKEHDLTGMRKRDIIRNIIHSKFTWKPSQKREQPNVEPELKYATISTNNKLTPPHTPAGLHELQPKLTSTPATSDLDNASISNYSLITTRFNDPSMFPNPDEIFAQPTEMAMSKTTTTLYDAQSFTNMRPALPLVQSSSILLITAAPPPPSAIQATANYSRTYSRTNSQYATLPRQKEPNVVVMNESLYGTVKQKRKQKPLHVNIPQPSSSTLIGTQFPNSKGVLPPPTPPKPMSKNSLILASNLTPKPPSTTTQTKSTPAMPSPPPMQSLNPTPQPPPPPMLNAVGSVIPPPAPPPMPNALGAPMPPPPPPMPNAARAQNSPRPPASTLQPPDGDPRDALLESIRNGVALKKVNKKGATISGIKPRPERKPQTIDFLSELKMGLTMRRTKNSSENPFAKEEPEESNA